jgi:ribosomal protein L37AE/L43A
MNSKETKKDKNVAYYRENKESILKKLQEKEQCEYCKRQVTHQRMTYHQTTAICQKIRHNGKDRVTDLENELKELKKLLAEKKA